MKVSKDRLKEIIKEELSLFGETELDSLMSKHDWYHDMSDDHGVWLRGMFPKREILRAMKRVDQKVAQRLFKKYAPPEFKFSSWWSASKRTK